MFGTNTITGKKLFNKHAETTPHQLMVTSIFYSFQGEGPFTGQPAVFVRLSKCHLTCSFCDAYFEEGDFMEYAEILEKAIAAVANVTGLGIAAAREFTRKRVGIVVTGGEPMLQDNLKDFFAAIAHRFAWYQVETNGTQDLDVLSKTVKIVVSPKCSEKNGVPTKYLQPHRSVMTRSTALKFVVSADPSSPYHDIPEFAKQCHARGMPVYVSPMNVYARLPAKAQALKFTGKAALSERSTTDEVVSFWQEGLLDRKANQANHEYAARLAVANGYIFNLQQHLYGSMA